MVRSVKASQIAEWHTLKEAVVYTPSVEVAYAQLSPIENLYDDVIKLEVARKEHMIFKETLKSEGVKVYELMDLVNINPAFKNYVKKRIERLYETSNYIADLKWLNSLNYIINNYSPETLWLMAILRPELINVSKEEDMRARSSLLHIHPLGNLFYMRDQQFVTDKGLVMGNLRMPARAGETEITELGFASLGIKPVYKMNSPLEGGDFLPAGNVAFLGRGYRNTNDSVNELLNSGALGYDTIAVVKQPANQETMHLDTYFNILGPTLVVGDRDILKNSDCTLYKKENSGYTKVETLKFYAFLKKKGFEVLELDLKKERFGTNFLTLNERKILMPVNYKLRGTVKLYEKAGVEVVPIKVNELLAGYGGVHCMTCALRREK